jgi:hypothetical protein
MHSIKTAFINKTLHVPCSYTRNLCWASQLSTTVACTLPMPSCEVRLVFQGQPAGGLPPAIHYWARYRTVRALREHVQQNASPMHNCTQQHLTF